MQVDIIIPTMDNRAYLEPCVRSLLTWPAGVSFRVIVVNNGQPGSIDWLDEPLVDVVEASGNLGWTAGLALGLTRSSAEVVCFLNDDTLILPGSFDWLEQLVDHLEAAHVGAVGPATNCAIGVQSIFTDTHGLMIEAPFLVGFCLLMKRDVLDRVGGVDTSLPGGDDIDLSIRLRKNSLSLLVDRSVFVYHHGFKTGERVYGPASRTFGWNSREYSTAVQQALLEKHGPDGLRLIGWGV
jgi:O-antigen biosynthesis protein